MMNLKKPETEKNFLKTLGSGHLSPELAEKIDKWANRKFAQNKEKKWMEDPLFRYERKKTEKESFLSAKKLESAKAEKEAAEINHSAVKTRILAATTVAEKIDFLFKVENEKLLLASTQEETAATLLEAVKTEQKALKKAAELPGLKLNILKAAMAAEKEFSALLANKPELELLEPTMAPATMNVQAY